MNPVEAIPRSPLEKPLGDLTEEDIAQLTREDCRRFLKEKGMRRPSWNKSQAIQQVISLKALLEARPDSDDPAAELHQKPPPPPLHVSFSSPPRKEANCDLKIPAPASEPAPYRRRDPISPIVPFPAAGDAPERSPVVGREQLQPENNCISPRVAATVSAGQMTIFYGGKVSVYDGVPAEKARAIMQVAASPDCYDYDTPSGPVSSCRPLPCRFPTACHRPGPIPIASPGSGIPPIPQSEGPTNRKASLQRYLEKRKDRGRFKDKRIFRGSSSASMEIMYLSHKFKGQTPNEQSGRSDTSSPTHPRPPRTPTRCSSIENQTQNLRISVDLNVDGGGN